MCVCAKMTFKKNFCFQVYWVGPMSGGVMAALIYHLLLSPIPGDLPQRLKVLCHGHYQNERQPLLGGAEGDQWTK